MPVLIAGFLPSTSYADPGNPILAFAARPEHRQVITTTAVETFNKLQGCNDARVISYEPLQSFPTFGPLAVDANGNLSSGVIRESVTVAGCGKQKLENIMTLSDKGQLKSIAGLPGTSKADPVLAKDSMQYAYVGVMRKIGQCKALQVIDTRFDDFEGPANPRAKSQKEGGRPWQETWTLNACGMIVDSVLHFIPDEKGTAISAAVPKN
jgi:hypothetical protein